MTLIVRHKLLRLPWTLPRSTGKTFESWWWR